MAEEKTEKAKQIKQTEQPKQRALSDYQRGKMDAYFEVSEMMRKELGAGVRGCLRKRLIRGVIDKVELRSLSYTAGVLGCNSAWGLYSKTFY